MPPVPLETKHHPSAVDLLLIKRLITETSKQNLLQFLQHEFVNIGKSYATRLVGMWNSLFLFFSFLVLTSATVMSCTRNCTLQEDKLWLIAKRLMFFSRTDIFAHTVFNFLGFVSWILLFVSSPREKYLCVYNESHLLVNIRIQIYWYLLWILPFKQFVWVGITAAEWLILVSFYFLFFIILFLRKT